MLFVTSQSKRVTSCVPSKEQWGSRHDGRTKTGGGYKSTLWDREKEGARSVVRLLEGGGGTTKNDGNIVKGLGK